MGLGDRATDQPEALKAPATNLTIGSGVVAAVAAAATLYNDTFESIFGDDASTTIKASVLIAIIGAWAIVTSADLITRAIAKSATERGASLKQAAATNAAESVSVVPLPQAVAASRTQGPDQDGFLAVALRSKGDGGTAVLLTKAGEAPVWVDHRDVSLGG